MPLSFTCKVCSIRGSYSFRDQWSPDILSVMPQHINTDARRKSFLQKLIDEGRIRPKCIICLLCAIYPDLQKVEICAALRENKSMHNDANWCLKNHLTQWTLDIKQAMEEPKWRSQPKDTQNKRKLVHFSLKI